VERSFDDDQGDSVIQQLVRYFDLAALAWVLVVTCVASVVAAALASQIRGRRAAIRTAGWILLGGSIAAVTVITLLRSRGGVQSVNLIPLQGIKSELRNGNPHLAQANLWGNAALFVPTGFLAGTLFRRAWPPLVLIPMSSAVIEVVQHYTGLSSDIDDLLLNSIGGAAGVVVGRLVVAAIRHTAPAEPL
jgi:hypothetical protein